MAKRPGYITDEKEGGGGLKALLNRPIARRSLLKSALATAPLLVLGSGASILKPDKAQAATNIGPSTQTDPYLVPTVPGVNITSILTTGDKVGAYRMVGIPDGLGVFNSSRTTFTVLMNHEITNTKPGIVRAHGSNGAFVSRWLIDRRTLQVLKGEDLTPSALDVFLWDPVQGKYVAGTTQWQRLCSADLPAVSALSDGWNLGTEDRIFFDGEEVNDPNSARAWARIVTGLHAGEAWQLPRFGRHSYENCVACPYEQSKTIVMLLDDGDLSTAATTTGFPSEVFAYIGRKQRFGHPVEQAGLTNGSLFGLKITVNGVLVKEESDAFGFGTTAFVGNGRFTLVELGDVSSMTQREIEDKAQSLDVARLRRVEDGAWDPRKGRQNNFYFVTTADVNTNSRLWHLKFDDIERPERGGTIEILLKGTEGHRMLDNVTMDHHGRIVMDEDPGNNTRVSKVWLYQVATGQLIQVAQHNSKFFDPNIGSPDFITQDEESSGIIDAEDILGKGWFLLDVQSHKASDDTELVEGGQLLAMFIDPRIGAAPRNDDDDDDHDHGHGNDDHDHGNGNNGHSDNGNGNGGGHGRD